MKQDADQALPGKRIVQLVGDIDTTRGDLTAQEGFVLSRIDGHTPMELLCAITGLGETLTVYLVKSLAHKGILRVHPPFELRSETSPQTEVARQESRQRISSSLGNARSPSGSSHKPPSTSGEQQIVSAVRIDPALEASLALEEQQGIDLKRETRIRVRELRERLTSLSFFELLGVPIDSDVKAIRRGYFERSKEFHPDRYYTKQLGPYKEMLAEIFRQVSAAYEFLLDDTKRAAYRGTIEEQEQNETLQQQVAREAHEMLSGDELDLNQDETVHPRGEEQRFTDPREQEVSARPRTAAVMTFMKRHLRDQFRAGRSHSSSDMKQVSTPLHAESASKEPSGIVEQDSLARANRREIDRIRTQYVRKKTFRALLSQRRDKAAGFHAQGVKQLQENKPVAAAASMKLAVSFDPENQEYRHQYEIAAEASRAITAENSFKRALFEESVGRHETASTFYQMAANTSPREAYLLKAAQTTILTGELIKAREYATKAVQVAKDSVESRLMLARVLLAAGQKKAARREVDTAKKLAPGNPEIKELLKQIRRL